MLAKNNQEILPENFKVRTTKKERNNEEAKVFPINKCQRN